jgi:hypothetical protein
VLAHVIKNQLILLLEDKDMKKNNMTKKEIIEAMGIHDANEITALLKLTKAELELKYADTFVDYTVENIEATVDTDKEEDVMTNGTIDGFAIIAEEQKAMVQKTEAIAVDWKEQLAVTLWFRRPYSGNKNRSVFYTANPRKEYSGKIIAVYDTLVKYVEYWQKQYCAKLGYDPNKCNAEEARKAIGKMVDSGYFKYGFGDPSKVVILTPKVMECKDAVLGYWNTIKQQ